MKKLVITMLCLINIFGPTLQVCAKENTEIPSLVVEETGEGENAGEQYNSVLQVVVYFTNEDGKEKPIQGGSGFLIGSDNSQLQYMITTNEVIQVTNKTKKKVKKKYKLDSVDVIKEEIKVVINNDVTIKASIVTNSKEMDFAILKLEQPIYDRQALLLNDKDATGYLEQSAVALGYPSAVKYGNEMKYYTSNALQKTEGFLEAEEIINGQKYIKHHIFPNYGNLGGPIVEQSGSVVALNQGKNDGKSFFALKITEIMHVMDSLGISYKTVSQMEAEKAAELALIVHKEELNALISKAEQLDLSEYKSKSRIGFAECIEEAKKIQENDEVTQEDVDETVVKMQNAIDALKLKAPLKVILGVIGISCLSLTVVVLIILQVTKQKRIERREKKKAQFTVTEPAPVFLQRLPVQETSYQDLIKAGNSQVENVNIWNVQETDAETTLLSDDWQDDSIIGHPSITLIRSKNNENILVNKFPFVIGKDKCGTDYCVWDNAVVSRVHAVFFYEDKTFYIQDNNATNGTFVNGRRLIQGEKKALNNNDIIRLANEEFEVKVSLL